MILPETVLQDLRYGARMLRRNVGFTVVAVLALAIGIGLNTAVFTIYKGLIDRHFDARNPDDMVNLALIRESGDIDFSFSYPDYEAYRDSAHSFSGLIAFTTEHPRLSNAGGLISQRTSAAGSLVGRLGLLPSMASNAEFANVYVVSENYFKVLGVAALRGRTFDSIGIRELVASPAVLITENYWQRRFGSDPAMLGRTILLNTARFTIVGVTPHNFVGTSAVVPDFWLPLRLQPLLHPDDNSLRDRENQRCRLFGRLAPGVSQRQAQAEMTLLADHVRTLHDPHSESAKPVTALVWPGTLLPRPLKLTPGPYLAIRLIMVAAGMVLAVACANVASLQMARARSRQNELLTRLSLGASRLRIVRQLLTESALLGLVSGVMALLFTWALLRASVALAANAFPADEGTLIINVNPDLQIFAYVTAISLVAGILFGLAPALESSRSALSSSERGSTSPARSRRIQDFLIAAQVALSAVLLIAGSMLIRSAINSLKMDTGYDSKHVVELDLQFPEGSKYNDARKLALVDELRTRLAALPGVAALTSARQPVENFFQTAATPAGEKSPAQNIALIHYTYVQSNYFQTLGIPMLLGRSFRSQAGQPEHSVIVSESAARQFFPGRNPIGHSLRLGAADEQFHKWSELVANGPTYQIIGIARDTRGAELNGNDSRQLYLPLPDDRLWDHSMLIRTQSSPILVIRAMDSVISSVDPDLVATSITLEEMLHYSGSFLASTLSAAIASVIGLIGLVLALMGIYGTVSYIVVLRTREIGIRMAVGAQGRDILGLILRESTRPVLAGLFAGMFLAIGASYVLRGLLFGLHTVDGISFVGVSLLFLAVALLAAYPPSRRATRVDPMVALRYE